MYIVYIHNDCRSGSALHQFVFGCFLRIAVEIERCDFPSLPDMTYLRNRIKQSKNTNHYSTYLNQFVDIRWKIVSFAITWPS